MMHETFELSKINSLPSKSDVDLLCDFFEIRCIISKNKSFSKSDFDSFSRDAKDVQIDAEEEFLNEDMGHDSDSNNFTSDVSLAESLNISPSNYSQKLENKWNDILKRFQSRQKIFSNWPFEIDDNGIALKISALYQYEKFYIYLVICSSMRILSKEIRLAISKQFEFISFEWLKLSLGKNWIVEHFSESKGKKIDKLLDLANKIGAFPIEANLKLIKETDSGDGGIDLVAWLHLFDKRGFKPVIFGQCACSVSEWEKKQNEVHPDRFKNLFVLQHPNSAFIFSPLDFFLQNDVFVNQSKLGAIVFIDRFRIIQKFVNDNFTIFDCHLEFVDKILNYSISE